MDDVIKYFNEILPSVAKKVDITGDSIKGFDGDAWIWVWRRYIGEGADRRGAETIFRVQPDTFYERVSTEVVAHAWKEMQRHVSWSMTYGVQVLEVKDFRAQAEKWLMPQLSSLLLTAWKEALQQAVRLDTLQERQKKLQDELRRQKLMDA
jgi:hypothetical protein